MTDDIDAIKSALSYDKSTGIITWRNDRSPNARAGSKAGTRHPDGYTRINLGGKFYYAHRLAWLFAYCRWPCGVIDHIDGDPSNNVIENLRECRQAENTWNRRAKKRSASGLKGVWYDKRTGRWGAEIIKDGRKHWLGRHDTAEEAGKTYMDAAQDVHGKFAPVRLARGGKIA